MAGRRFLWALVVYLVMASSLWGAPLEATLDADELTFDESCGMAHAHGNAVLRYQGMRVYADTLEIDTATNLVKASSSAANGVSLISGGRVLRGQYAEYDLTAREGVLYETSGSARLDESGKMVYLKGQQIEVATVASARRKGWLPKKTVPLSEDAMVGRWEGVFITTCPQPHPHYRLKAKRLVLIPGDKVLISSPQVYLGERLLFTYPFDYRVNLQEHQKGNAFLPQVDYNSDKGVGAGLSGSLYWDDGSLEVSTMAWSDEGLEWKGRIEQELVPWLQVYGETAWVYRSWEDRKVYTPVWGVLVKETDWEAGVRWTQRETLGGEKRLRSLHNRSLWRMPEVYVTSPWWRLSAEHPREYLRLKATWGHYEEVDNPLPETERLELGGEAYGRIGAPSGSWEPFWHLAYRDFRYDLSWGKQHQRVTDATVGVLFRGRSGFEAGTAYVRRWVDGASPFAQKDVEGVWNAWDDYDDEILLYQRLAFRLSSSFRLSLLGAYDLDQEHLDEIAYRLTYANNCCYQWVLTYRDDRCAGDDWASLSFQLTAFPDRVARFGESELDDPFEVPEGLPKE
ncbi:MAG: hypothetical protein CSA35_09350 [Dethiosulfovibrio peptidovorans]|nr:MAG: hypothetical protein CSA35_09350 [Dethiosulfovibrio peptidovorans]